jgi:hypothetical protein
MNDLPDDKDDYQALHDKSRTEQWLADSWHYRQRKCNAMLRTINQMKLDELERRIKNADRLDSAKETN